MIKVDPIIAVKDVQSSSAWYPQVFGCRNAHGGGNFAVLVGKDDEVLICLHKWEEHSHPTMKDSSITPGNGLILYFKTDNLQHIIQNIEKMGSYVEEELHLNTNSTKRELSLRDPDGYYLTITEYHKYEG